MNFILTTPSDLKNIFLEALKEHINHQQPVTAKQAHTAVKYFTRKETADQLNVTLPTLNKYVKSGKIKCHKIGRRVLFRNEDIENAIVKPKY